MKLIQYAKCLAVASIAAAGLSSCVSDEPFATDGEGQLKFKMVVNSEVSRAETDELSLADKCVIYLSDSKGLIYKYQGIDQVPSDLYLKCGSYVAEAWTGDSVSASFDKKFYRAYEPFQIERGVNNVILTCRIANVVASINPEPIIDEALKDYQVTVENSRGSLVFDSSNAATAHGYFMMPNDDTDLKWTITGKRETGEDFTKSGVIPNVQRAHEYVLNIKYTPSVNEIGGGIITVVIDDNELLVEDEVVIYTAPKINGIGFDLDAEMTAAARSFSKHSIFVQANGKLSEMSVTTDEYAAFGLPRRDFNFVGMTPDARATLASAGITAEDGYNAEADVTTCRINLSADMLNRLPDGKYTLNITAKDERGKQLTKQLVINVSDAAVTLTQSDWNEMYSYSATLHGNYVKASVANPGIRYRAVGDASWTTVSAPVSAPGAFSVKLTGLRPATKYEYQAVGDGYVNTESLYFTTESVYALPNAGFEEWSNLSSNSKVLVPGAGGVVSFWDTGNHGSSTLSKLVTNNATSPVHSGQYSVGMISQFVGMGSIGKFAAGNIFAGSYDKTDGTNGELTFGRKYDGSRPQKLSGYIYYTPGTVDYSETSMLPKGQTDQGQIYVALTTEPVKIKTKTKELFDPNADYVVAYGEMTLNAVKGSSTAMDHFEINLNYKKTDVKPVYLVIVCSASKYGDYFTGSSSSKMYVDDFELIYE